MTQFTDIAQRYVAAWNETDPQARQDRVADLWAADGTYVDPLADVQGRDQIATLIAAVQDQFPGFRFRLAGDVDGHADAGDVGLGGQGEPQEVGEGQVIVDDEYTQLGAVRRSGHTGLSLDFRMRCLLAVFANGTMCGTPQAGGRWRPLFGAPAAIPASSAATFIKHLLRM